MENDRFVGPARILQHGSNFTAVDRFGVVCGQGKDAGRLALKISAKSRTSVFQEPRMQFAREVSRWG